MLRIPNGDGSRKIRVVPNKFAALARELPPVRAIHPRRRTIQGFGVHDLIVETTDHSQAMALMSDSRVTDVLRSYKARYETAAEYLCNVKVDTTVGAGQGAAAGAGG